MGVYNSTLNSLEQFTDYYPYGLPHASATSPSVNRRKYGGKELTTDCGLNLCDFSARWHNPAFPAFTTPDPMADKYTPLSPYTYCGGDPINQIDPTGMVFSLANLSENEMRLWNETISHLTQTYSLFNALYSFLEESPVEITVMFGSLEKNTGESDAGQYDDKNKTLTLSSTNFIFGTTELQISETTLFEEAFHAFQNQNIERYGDVEFNKEFEAKLFKNLCYFEKDYGCQSSLGGLSEICENLNNLDYGNIKDVYRQLYESTSRLNLDYIKYANQFARYCQDHKKGNNHYIIPTANLPIGLQIIFKLAFNDK